MACSRTITVFRYYTHSACTSMCFRPARAADSTQNLESIDKCYGDVSPIDSVDAIANCERGSRMRSQRQERTPRSTSGVGYRDLKIIFEKGIWVKSLALVMRAWNHACTPLGLTMQSVPSRSRPDVRDDPHLMASALNRRELTGMISPPPKTRLPSAPPLN